ncbi:MAG: metallophosphoesterase [Lentisphaeria bacterium]|jgi:hypothetical protein|nr:metallophosphoesterase [Lentisphaeria bacterium]
MRLAFLGDTHFCIPRTGSGGRVLPDRLPDHFRYTPMADSVLRPLLARIRSAAPDVLISSGDFVEGGLSGDPPAARREMVEGLAFFAELGLPFVIARGTHDAPDLFAELALPAMNQALGAGIDRSYFRHDAGDCTLLVLDYQRYAAGNPQDAWCEAQLAAAAGAGRRIFVVAHAPVYLWGRHFFGDPALIRRLDTLFSAYPVEAYLCGHTHNQAVSFHARQGNRGWLQLMASSVGYAALPGQPLEQTHRLADFGPENRYLWGIAEDSAPGFFLLDLDPDGLCFRWESVGGESREFRVAGRRALPVCHEAPPVRVVPAPEDFCQLKSAVFGVFSYSGNVPAGEVWLNGVPLGPIPSGTSYAARRFLPVPAEGLATIGPRNTLTVRTPAIPAFAVGSFRLELLHLDGRMLHSRVVPEILVAGDRWQAFPGERPLVPCVPGDMRELALEF